METVYQVCLESSLWGAAWTLDGQKFAVCGSNGLISVFELVNGEPICIYKLGVPEEKRTIRSVAWSKEGLLAIASFDGWTDIYLESTRILRLEGHESEVKAVAWGIDNLLATCGRDKCVWIWQIENMQAECLAVLQEHEADVKSVIFHPNRRMLASCGGDDTIRIWTEDQDGEWNCISILKGHVATVWNMLFYNDTIISCSEDGTIRLWKPHDPKSIQISISQLPIYSLSLHPTQPILAIAGADNNIHLYDTSTFTLIKSIPAHLSDINCITWQPTSPAYLLSVSDDNIFKFWSINK